jgi:drug/metabolite transporter (DMT)-like permease
MVGERPARLNVLLFVALVLIWGCSFLLIKVSLEGFRAPQVAVLRSALGALTMIIVLLVTRRRLPRDRRLWLHMFVVASTQCTIPFTLTSETEQYLPSSLAGIDNATAPMFTAAFLPLLLRSEKLSRRQLLGLAIGVIGVAVLVRPWQTGGPVNLLAECGMLGSAAVYGFGLVYMRRFVSGRSEDPIAIATVQMLLCLLPLLIAAPFTSLHPVRLSWRVGIALFLLGAAGTGISYIWNARLVRDWGASRMSTVTYLMPVVGVLAGTTVLGESLQWNQPVGGLIVLAGVLVAQRPAVAAAEVSVATPADR